MQQSLALSRYDFTIEHIAGKKNKRADTLLKREQDLLVSLNNARIQFCIIQLLKPHIIGRVAAPPSERPVKAALANCTALNVAEEGLLALQKEAKRNNSQYQAIRLSIQEGKRVFPINLSIKVSILEYSLEDRKVLFCNKK